MNTAMESAERDRTLSLGGYVIDQKRSTPLGPVEQQRRATLYSQTRDPKIEHRFIEANLRLVIKIAREVDRHEARHGQDPHCSGGADARPAGRFLSWRHGAAEVSFDTPRTTGATPLQDVLVDPAPTVEEAVGADELARRLKSEMPRLKAGLSRREMTVLDERLLAEDPKSFRIIGRKLSVSGERVRQIEAKLLATIGDGMDLGGVSAAA